MKRTNEFQRYIDFRWAQLGYDDKKLKEFVDRNAPKGVNFDTDFDAFIQICHQDFYVNKDNISMSLWHQYSENGGSADFETFYSHKLENQKLLVKVARGKALLTRSL